MAQTGADGGPSGRRERLLHAGSEIFERRAFDEVSVGEIAARAGVAHGLLFHYFGSKRKFYAAVIRHQVEQAEASHRANTISDPARWLRSDVEIFLRNLADNPRSATTFARTGVGTDPMIDEVIEEFRATTTARILDHAAASRPSALLLAAIQGWINFSLEVGRSWVQSEQQLSREHVRVLLIDQLVAALDSVVRLEPGVGVDPSRFRD